MKNPIKIAITGKIGSGKSTVAEIIKDIGYFVFESDKEVDKLFNSNHIKNKIQNLFYKIQNLTNKDGSINKTLLGDYVFSNKSELKTLEDLIYPLLKKERQKFINSKKMEKILFFDIPLLFEKKLFKEYNFIIYVYVKDKIQKERVLRRKKMNKDKLKKILEAQTYNLKDYQKFISIKIDTSNDLDQTKQSLISFLNKKVLGYS
ncbi:MAG: dephospho-CoA kinase [Rickettsiales bacterium]|nr:dephospho-CoA kinase [Rickettsiales bacterium]RPG13648.1 MAG: dephospho-CoA kinase [Pelagibacteraceae bacterium TMED195]